MFCKALWLAVSLIGIAGCTSVPDVPSPSQLPWHDDAFAYDAQKVTVAKEELFRLDPALIEKLKDPTIQLLSTTKRLEYLLGLIYGGDKKPFAYKAGHSTVAAETWQQKRGDCLSLTVLVFSMAREMGMVAQMQEVKVPAFFDRRGNVDFLSDHVNVLFRRIGSSGWSDDGLQSSDMVVDFEPQARSNREGHALSDNAILARYYNNIAAEHLVNDSQSLAYAYFRAAILADPAFPFSYSNLALLYQRRGFDADIEQLLRNAVLLSDGAIIPLSSLHQLLLAQGRQTEAAHYARLLQSRREIDPYYWIGLGLKHLQDGQVRESIYALEQAQRLTSGFQEVHRYLALAYWRAGEQVQANKQLSLLASPNPDNPDVTSLRKKFNAP